MDLSSLTRTALLAALIVHQDMHAGEVYEQLGIPRSTVSGLVTAMEREGLVDVFYSKAPGRGPARRMFRLTAKGHEVAGAHLSSVSGQVLMMNQAVLRLGGAALPARLKRAVPLTELDVDALVEECERGFPPESIRPRLPRPRPRPGEA